MRLNGDAAAQTGATGEESGGAASMISPSRPARSDNVSHLIPILTGIGPVIDGGMMAA